MTLLRSPADISASAIERTSSDLVSPSGFAETFPLTWCRDLGTNQKKDWLVQSMLGAGELSVLYGPPGCGKSVLAGDLGFHIATNAVWHGKSVLHGSVLYVAAERAMVVKRRFVALMREDPQRDVPLAVVGGVFDLCHPSGDTQKIIATCQLAEQQSGVTLRMIIIDTVSQVLAGGDENGPKDMGALMMNVRRILEATGAHVLLVHHSPYDNPGKPRGHSALLGAADTTIQVGKNINHSAWVVKANDAEEGTKVRFFLQSVNIGQDDQGQITTAPVCIPIYESELGGVAVPGEQGGIAKKPLPATQEIAFRLLHKAVAKTGEVPPPFSEIPADTRVVSTGTWRTYCDDQGLTDSESSEAKRKAFNRARTELLKRGLIDQWQQWVWVVSKKQTGTVPGHVPGGPGTWGGTNGGSLEPMSRLSQQPEADASLSAAD